MSLLDFNFYKMPLVKADFYKMWSTMSGILKCLFFTPSFYKILTKTIGFDKKKI